MIDITKGTHVSSFPSKVASMMGQYAHVYNMVLTANTDNGAIRKKGDYVSFDRYEDATVTDSDVKGVIREKAADGRYLVEFTVLPTSYQALYIYNAPVSEYTEKEFQDESLFFNKAGEVAQGAVLCLGDTAAYSANAFEGTPAAEAVVFYKAGKWEVQ